MSADCFNYQNKYYFKVFFFTTSINVSEFIDIISKLDNLSIVHSGSICTCRSNDNDWICITESRILMLAICYNDKDRRRLFEPRITNKLKVALKDGSIESLFKIDPFIPLDFIIYTNDLIKSSANPHSQKMQLEKILESDFFLSSDQERDRFDLSANVEIPTEYVIASLFERLLICYSLFSVHKLLIEEFPRIVNAKTNSNAINVQKRYIIHQSLIHPNDYDSPACNLSRMEWEKGMTDLADCCKMTRLDFEEQRIKEKQSMDRANELREEANDQREAAAARQAKSDSMMNFFMLLLASLTACSTVFDILDWIREVINNGLVPYNISVIMIIVALFLITVFCISRIGNPFRKKSDSGDA